MYQVTSSKSTWAVRWGWQAASVPWSKPSPVTGQAEIQVPSWRQRGQGAALCRPCHGEPLETVGKPEPRSLRSPPAALCRALQPRRPRPWLLKVWGQGAPDRARKPAEARGTEPSSVQKRPDGRGGGTRLTQRVPGLSGSPQSSLHSTAQHSAACPRPRPHEVQTSEVSCGTPSSSVERQGQPAEAWRDSFPPRRRLGQSGRCPQSCCGNPVLHCGRGLWRPMGPGVSRGFSPGWPPSVCSLVGGTPETGSQQADQPPR